ncbi:hypothetical protein Tco_0843491 [Tanacetum coccineum]|uniref:Uncharacterized protein n=1 Tax=Tanacetum coccineum TaxID=301880 RepID=A0ABQ5B6I2_9ASTR
MYYPRFTKVTIHHFLIQEKSFSWRNRIGMHTSKDDYLINTLRFISRKEASHIYGAVLPECLTSPEMKESKAYKTYLGYATGEVPPKVARKFKKASLSKKESEIVPGDEEPVKKGKRLKTPAKKSASKPATGIVIREPPVEEKSKRKEKRKVRKKSLRDFHKTHPSGSGTITEKLPSVKKIIPTITSEGTGDKLGVPDVTNDDSSESEFESWGNDEDDSNNEQESSDESSKQENESEEQESDSEQDEESNDDQEEEEFDQENESEDDEIKSDEEQGMDDTTNQFDDDADARLEEPTETGIVQDIPQTDAEIMSPLYVHVHHEVPRTQAPTLLTILVSVIPESLLATPTPPPIIETINPLSNLPDFSSVFQFNDRITALEKDVVDLKKDPLHTQVTSLVNSHLDTRLGETRQEFINFLSKSLTARIKEQVKDQLPQILPQEVSNFAPPVIEKLIKESRDKVTLVKVSSQPQSTYEAASSLTEFELQKILIDKIEKSESYLAAPEHRDCYYSLKKSYDLDKDLFYSYDVYSLKRDREDKDKDGDLSVGSDRGLKNRKTSKDVEPTTGPKKKDSTSGSSKGTKSQPKYTGKYVQSKEPVFEVADSDMPQDQTGNLGDNEDEPRDETVGNNVGKTTKEECYKALSEKLDWENPEGGDYPFDLSKPLPLITWGKRQRVPFKIFINNDLKYLQGGISTMTYTTSTTKTNVIKYDLPSIEDMIEQRKSFYAYARGIQLRGDVYSTKRIMAVTHVSVMRKHGYMYLKEIVVRRADNNRLTNLSGDDVADFAIALRMFTRSLVIQKRVEDLQLGVKSYQKQINVTKPDTTRPNIRKRHSYTSYKDPQGFIYVDNIRRNRLMHFDELYKFCDGTLTRLLSSLEDITKNIDMTYLPKRRWSNLEKKRAHFMIKDINKLLKERRMMRSLEKFVGGRLYGTDLRLLQRTI